ncbi:hypothetical protein RRG08_062254 [Elysia crispata]|uniref:Uncharacterized protein n=1 Tax=Elysia crispata TaxID=231223 RepID=A0AAE1CYR3_9GAST|nr:hypothetical protein RRG08_062254 [Elysia crispata]
MQFNCLAEPQNTGKSDVQLLPTDMNKATVYAQYKASMDAEPAGKTVSLRTLAVTVQAEPNYCNMINEPHIITKKGMSFSKNPVYVEQKVGISEAKRADMKKLMQEHAGEGWETDQRFEFVASVVSGRVNLAQKKRNPAAAWERTNLLIDFNAFFFFF